MAIIMNKHSREGKLVLALCDESLLGKKFEEDNKILDLTSNFYNGVKTDEAEIKTYIPKAFTINAVGEQSVGLLIREGLVKREDTKKIDDIPFAMTASMAE